MQDDEPEVVKDATAVVLSIGPTAKDAVPILTKIIADKKSEARYLAIQALGRIGPGASDAVPALIDVLSEKDSPIPLFAVIALGQIGPAAKEAVPILRQALPDANQNLRVNIEKALKAIEK